MKRNLFYVLIGLIFLTTIMFVGTPFEFLNPRIDTIVTFIIMGLIVFLFIILFRLTLKLNNKILKFTIITLLTILTIPYLFVGIWTTLLTSSSNHPIWKDYIIYTNDNNEKVISEWRETSGSIWDYRDRKILADFGQFRISYACNKKNLKGIWKEYNIDKDTTITINFDKK